MLTLLDAPSDPVIGPDHPGLAGNAYGFEGGCAVKEDGVYHLFCAEMAGDPFWVRMRLAHWRSSDGIGWSRLGTILETDGRIDLEDPRSSLWAPMVVFDEGDGRWNLFYVAYRPGDAAGSKHFDGRIWRAVSATPGRSGIAGPYQDVGVIMQPDTDSQAWEGQQGVDSFFPWWSGTEWLAFYGSHNFQPPGPWLVGLARAPVLAGPWSRCRGNPSPIETQFIENPIVIRHANGFIAIYDSCGDGGGYQPDARHIGYATSTDGIHWSAGRRAVLQPATGTGQWSEDMRTPLGLISEPDGTFTVPYTAQMRGRRFWAVGVACLRLEADHV